MRILELRQPRIFPITKTFILSVLFWFFFFSVPTPKRLRKKKIFVYHFGNDTANNNSTQRARTPNNTTGVRIHDHPLTRHLKKICRDLFRDAANK